MLALLLVDCDNDGLSDVLQPPVIAALSIEMPAPACRREQRQAQLPARHSPAIIHAATELTESTHHWVALLARWTSVYSTGPPA